jgi:hypothetical protein
MGKRPAPQTYRIAYITFGTGKVSYVQYAFGKQHGLYPVKAYVLQEGRDLQVPSDLAPRSPSQELV